VNFPSWFSSPPRPTSTIDHLVGGVLATDKRNQADILETAALAAGFAFFAAYLYRFQDLVFRALGLLGLA